MRIRAAKPADPAKAVLYIRASTLDQALSPAAQRVAAERWCEARGVAIIATFADEGVSGGDDLERCPGLLGALDALGELDAGMLLVTRRDRLARDVVKAAMIERLASRHGARVVSVAGEGEGDDPASALMRRMIDAFAEYERAVLKARTKAALAVKQSRGELVGSVPYGKRLAADGRMLEDEPAEQRVIAVARELRGSGLSLAAVAAELSRQGFAPREGETWHKMQIARMLAA